MLSHTPSHLSHETEDLVTRIIGCAVEVHRQLGPGYLETVYQRALQLELAINALPYVCEEPILVYYKGTAIQGQRVDFIIDGKVLVELKAVEAIHPVHVSQVVSYLKATDLQVGLLLNFNSSRLKDGLRRIVR